MYLKLDLNAGYVKAKYFETVILGSLKEIYDRFTMFVAGVAFI
jgi:hypothetical protein